MTEMVMRVPTPLSPLHVQRGLALTNYDKAEELPDNVETHFQPVNDPSDPADIEMVNVAMRAYEYAPASDPKLTILTEVLQDIRDSKLARLEARTVQRTGC
jgi:hypothetical protein